MTNKKAIPTEVDLRDYFAAEAMKEMLWDGEDDNECAMACYEIADAMIRARNEKTEDKAG
jgi:hypothetical protein